MLVLWRRRPFLSSVQMDEAVLAGLDARLRQLEDQIAIYQLLASYGPAADSRSGQDVASLWLEDGRYDFGGTPLVGSEAIAELVDLETHRGYVARGCAHVIGLPLIRVEADSATATGYSRVYVRDGDGWKVERASANRWELVRTEGGWRVANRVNRLLDGSGDGPALASGLHPASEGAAA